VIVLCTVLYRIYYDVLVATSTATERAVLPAAVADGDEPQQPPADSTPKS
jgi:hypothetical protein